MLKHSEGFTLLELLQALAVLGFVLTAVFTFYLAGLNSWNRAVDRMEHQQSARIAMDKMICELRYACAVEIPSGEDIYFHFCGDTKTYLFRESGGELIFESKTQSGQTYSHTKVALGITSLHFAVDESGTVSITVGAGGEAREFSLSGCVRPRNLP